MTNRQIIQKTAQFVEAKFHGESTGHDWWHIYRVWQLAKRIAEKEAGADLLIVELGALLHDIDDWKFNDGDIEAGPRAARKWLKSLEVDEEIITKIEDILLNVSFKGAHVKQKMSSLEGRIISDADKLDAMGAIGIARTFAFGGSQDRSIYDPAVKPVLHKSFDAYKVSSGDSLSHFYEKLLLLKDKLYTKTAKEMALHRHRIMEEYLDEFYKEWSGQL